MDLWVFSKTTMRLFVCFVLAALSAFGATDVTTRNAINQMPLRFEARSGQAWVARGMGFGVGVNRNGAVFGLGQEIGRAHV